MTRIPHSSRPRHRPPRRWWTPGRWWSPGRWRSPGPAALAAVAGVLAGAGALFVPPGQGAAQEVGQSRVLQAPVPQDLGRPMQPNPLNALPGQGEQGGPPGAPPPFLAEPYAGTADAGALLGTSLSHLFPGNVPVTSGVKSPVGDDPQAIERGMRYFVSLNCVGCHAPNGGGGMGPSLSNAAFIYGSEPPNIYLSIYQGRPRGMPSWGATLPDGIIWDLVAYIRNISQDMSPSWGRTISAKTMTIEQVPAEYLNSANPWSRTEPFSSGAKPNTAR